jgi:hypothetical protein
MSLGTVPPFWIRAAEAMLIARELYLESDRRRAADSLSAQSD